MRRRALTELDRSHRRVLSAPALFVFGAPLVLAAAAACLWWLAKAPGLPAWTPPAVSSAPGQEAVVTYFAAPHPASARAAGPGPSSVKGGSTSPAAPTSLPDSDAADADASTGNGAPRTETGEKLIMFSAPGCRDCASARALLSARAIAFVEYHVERPGVRAELTAMAQRAGIAPGSGVPIFFVGGKHLVGYDEARLLEIVR